MSFLRSVTFGFLASACAVASSVVAAPSYTGFYIGVEGGGSYWRMKAKNDSENHEIVEKLKFDDEYTSKGLGRIGGFIGGGKQFCGGFYLGGQIGGGALFGTLEEGGELGSVELKARYYYDADVHFGYVVTPGFLVYLSGGFEGHGTRVEKIVVKNAASLDGKDGDRTQIPFGTVGLGARYQLCNGLFFGAEAKAMFGAKKTWKVSSKNISKDSSAPAEMQKIFDNISNEVKLKTNQQNYSFTVSVGYKF